MRQLEHHCFSWLARKRHLHEAQQENAHCIDAGIAWQQNIGHDVAHVHVGTCMQMTIRSKLAKTQYQRNSRGRQQQMQQQQHSSSKTSWSGNAGNSSNSSSRSSTAAAKYLGQVALQCLMVPHASGKAKGSSPSIDDQAGDDDGVQYSIGRCWEEGAYQGAL